MTIQIFHVVGDRFADFAATHDVVVRVSDLVDELRSSDFRYGADARFVPGQGLSPERVDELLRAAEEAGRAHHMQLWKPARRADQKLLHKGQAANISITAPMRVSETEFVCDLVLDENDCIVGDRINGQHIQGMVLVEAGRQMNVAVFEEFYIGKLPPEIPREYSFAVMVLNHSFLQYCYPVAMQIKLTMLAVDTTNPSKLEFHSTVDVVQVGHCVFQQEARAVCLPRKKAGSIELKRGGQVLEALQREHAVRVEGEKPAHHAI